jgi:hypothetical protein
MCGPSGGRSGFGLRLDVFHDMIFDGIIRITIIQKHPRPTGKAQVAGRKEK